MITLPINNLLACATCMTNGDDPISYAGSIAILFMLVVLTLMLCAFIRFMFYLARCERAAITPEAELLGIDPRTSVQRNSDL